MAVFDEFLKGRAARQTEQLRSGQITGMLQAQNMRDAKARKAERFTGLLTGMVDEQYAPLVQEGGVPGFNLAQTLQKQKGLDQKARVTAAEKSLTDALPAAIRITDPEEYNAFLDWAYPVFKEAGGDDETFDSIASLSMKDGQSALAQMRDVDMPKPEDDRLPVSGVEILVSKDDKQKSYDIGDPKQRKAYQAAIDKGDKPFVKESIVGKPGDFGTKKEMEKLRDTEIATRGAILTANKMLDMPDEAFQDAASFTRVLSGAGAEINALIDLVGIEEGETIESLRDASRYTSKFEELGIDSTIAQGHALDLALAYAGAIGLGQGRALTDKDVARALDRIGINGLRTKAARRAAIESVRDVLDDRYRIRHEVITGKPFEGNLGIPEADTSILDALASQFPQGGSNKFFEGIEYEYINDAWREK